MISPWRLVRRDTGEEVVAALEIAADAWSRFKGLQFRAGLAPGSGLLLVPCPSVHTFCMRFAIDVVLIDRGGGVVAVRRRVPPWRVVLPVPGAHATLELPAGTAQIEEGTALALRGPDPTAPLRPPRALAFLCSLS